MTTLQSPENEISFVPTDLQRYYYVIGRSGE